MSYFMNKVGKFGCSFKALLRFPSVYRLFRSIVAGRFDVFFASEIIDIKPGDRILDLGCGTGDILRRIPSNFYIGIDINSEYIRAARLKYGHRAQFESKRIGELSTIKPSCFDVVLAIGVIHHLEDQEALQLFRVAHDSLKPGGRLMTVDGCFEEGQKRLARLFLLLDRGSYVRQKDAYISLASQIFSEVDSAVRHDLIRIPYTHLIMTCSKKYGGELGGFF